MGISGDRWVESSARANALWLVLDWEERLGMYPRDDLPSAGCRRKARQESEALLKPG